MSGEILSHMDLYNHDSSVNFGWSRKPVADINLEKARFLFFKSLQKLRTKKWDYYYIFSRDFFFSITLATLGYAGMAFAYFYDYDSNSITEDSITIPLGAGFNMARNSGMGKTSLINKKIEAVFEVQKNLRHIILKYPSFNKGEGVEADISLMEDDALESICVATPIEKGKMNYTHKICCLPAKGFIKRGNNVIKLDPQRDLGGLDWSRGFLAYHTFWNWACASADNEGYHIGLNLCRGLNDTLDTENAFFIDGKCYKADKVIFEFDESDLMKPWAIKSSDGKVNLMFVPQKERIAKTDFKIIKSEIHQLFGHYSGELMLDGGGIVTVNSMRGAIEDHHARW